MGIKKRSGMKLSKEKYRMYMGENLLRRESWITVNIELGEMLENSIYSRGWGLKLTLLPFLHVFRKCIYPQRLRELGITVKTHFNVMKYSI